MKHIHHYTPYKRVKKLVLSKCKCGKGKTEIITFFDDEKGKSMDDLISKLRRGEK